MLNEACYHHSTKIANCNFRLLQRKAFEQRIKFRSLENSLCKREENIWNYPLKRTEKMCLMKISIFHVLFCCRKIFFYNIMQCNMRKKKQNVSLLLFTWFCNQLLSIFLAEQTFSSIGSVVNEKRQKLFFWW